ncbi:hypothetical protein F2Q70_00020427 [Brassica cretica]|uniref:Uncharacterized protein n=1 Tax=Brassica cretica TaxID=69181 RepID=A0A8S9GN49_BRACR|nr:hypothetical protein F2Q70_00020427 [Brassica cretica]
MAPRPLLRYCLPFVLSPSLQGSVAMAVCVHEHFSSIRVSNWVSRVSCRSGDFLEEWSSQCLPRRQFLFLFAGTEELDFACLFLSRFMSRAGGVSEVPVAALRVCFIFLFSFSALSFSMSVEVKSSERSLRTSYFGDDMGSYSNRGNEVNATSRDYHQWKRTKIDNLRFTEFTSGTHRCSG